MTERNPTEAASLAQAGDETEPDDPSRVRTRMCIGCGQRVLVPNEHGELVRLVFGPGGEIAVDARGGAFGRGAHVHPRRACLERAVSRGISRAFKGRVGGLASSPEGADPTSELSAAVPLSAVGLARAIEEAMRRRVGGLLTAAARARQVARGADAVTGAWQRGEAKLIVVARDAAAAAELAAVRQGIVAGRAIAWGTKSEISVAVDRGDRPGEAPGVIAITSESLAQAVRATVQTELLAAAAQGGSDAALGDQRSAETSPRRGRRDRGPCAPTTAGEEKNLVLAEESPSAASRSLPKANPPPRLPGGARGAKAGPAKAGPVGGHGHGGKRAARAGTVPRKDHRNGA